MDFGLKRISGLEMDASRFGYSSADPSTGPFPTPFPQRDGESTYRGIISWLLSVSLSCLHLLFVVMAKAYQPEASHKGLVSACRDGNEEEVRRIPGQQYASELRFEVYGKADESPLMAAASEGHLGLVKLLLEGVEGQELDDALSTEVSTGMLPVVAI